MGYSLWRSEDSEYTLGHRLGLEQCESSAPEPESPSVRASRPSREELDHIDFLMETLALRLENTPR